MQSNVLFLHIYQQVYQEHRVHKFFAKQFGWGLQLNKYEILCWESIVAVVIAFRLSSLAIQVVHQLFGQLFGQLPRQSCVFFASP